jgi:uncharacterized protein YigE (DUF2233 family)
MNRLLLGCAGPRSAIAGYLAILSAVLVSVLPARAADPPAGLATLTFRGASYVVREVDPKKDDVQFFLKDDAGAYLHDFAGLEKYVAGKGEKLLFAANAGMFQPDSSPVGLLVANGNQVAPLNTSDGQGNFFMKPNGVFLINAKHQARVVNAADYPDLLTPALWATQSGPLLVERGDIHPDFNAESKNLKIRSGVGVRADGVAVFALARTPVNFYHFAELFRDRLKCPNALFLDGDISQFYTPGFTPKQPPSFGPMLGVVVKAP